MNQPKRRRVYEVVERREYPYFEPGDKVKIEEYLRDCPPVPLPIQYTERPLDIFTIKKYSAPTSLHCSNGSVELEEFPGETFDHEYFMPADWTDEEWEASEANPLIVNRPIVPEVKIGFEKLVAELAALHQQETEFFTRLKEREAELENIARTQIASQSDKG